MLVVAGYTLDLERRYDPGTNLWVAELGDRDRARIGYDPLGAETTGDIVAISFAPIGTALNAGETFATVEAAKFVGPVATPIAGALVAVNERAAAAPGEINADPLGTWLVELADVDTAALDRLLAGEEAIRAWFAAAVERFRREGAIAE